MKYPYFSRNLRTDLTEQAALEDALDGLPIKAMRDTALLVLTEDSRSSAAPRLHTRGPDMVAARSTGISWCLGKVPGVVISRRFGIRGANVAWLVDDLDACSSYAAATAWLDYSNAPAIVAAIRFSGPSPRLVIWHWSPREGVISTRLMRADWWSSGCMAQAA